MVYICQITTYEAGRDATERQTCASAANSVANRRLRLIHCVLSVARRVRVSACRTLPVTLLQPESDRPDPGQFGGHSKQWEIGYFRSSSHKDWTSLSGVGHRRAAIVFLYLSHHHLKLSVEDAVKKLTDEAPEVDSTHKLICQCAASSISSARRGMPRK